ncbi:hypothetical protein GGQ61_001188 [Phenylobacterium haematophilum]|uniref:Uncharacterized protein n=1 Tax=Phenylobacterium haematophilum TaxID=98513 RepID=A0A839ZYP9_9CAUL|nr:hypothetical protein [Phenylobacterium haematophilum]MBB3890471.1 hypothetical protein [Phenylobacterium haematophilum]
MSVYLATWDLNKEKPEYAAARKRFIDRLNQYETIRDPGLDSVRYISTQLTAEQLSTDLRKYTDANDRIVVSKMVNGDFHGWLKEEVWAWIEARLK